MATLSHRPVLALLAAISLGATPAADLEAQTAARPQAQDVERSVDLFAKWPLRHQEAVVENLGSRLDGLDGPYHQALRACIEAGTDPGEPRCDAFPERLAPRQAPRPDPRLATDLPQQRHYVFGLGVVRSPPAPSRSQARKAAEAERRALLQTALMGMLPGADAAVAELLRQMDRDTRADRFAAFLESWRNGEESFYQALDRTAGTADSVFFYDAMLHDFAGAFGSGGDERDGLQEMHDSLHQGFLSYRQYRAFREAIAWSLVLPPDLPLPKALRRYETAPAGSYSLRDQVLMVLAIHDYDPRRLVDAVQQHAPPLPEPLWSATYDPYQGWNEIWSDTMNTMVSKAGSTDAWLKQARAQLAEWAAAVSTAATETAVPPGRRG